MLGESDALFVESDALFVVDEPICPLWMVDKESLIALSLDHFDGEALPIIEYKNQQIVDLGVHEDQILLR